MESHANIHQGDPTLAACPAVIGLYRGHHDLDACFYCKEYGIRCVNNEWNGFRDEQLPVVGVTPEQEVVRTGRTGYHTLFKWQCYNPQCGWRYFSYLLHSETHDLRTAGSDSMDTSSTTTQQPTPVATTNLTNGFNSYNTVPVLRQANSAFDNMNQRFDENEDPFAVLQMYSAFHDPTHVQSPPLLPERGRLTSHESQTLQFIEEPSTPTSASKPDRFGNDPYRRWNYAFAKKYGSCNGCRERHGRRDRGCSPSHLFRENRDRLRREVPDGVWTTRPQPSWLPPWVRGAI